MGDAAQPWHNRAHLVGVAARAMRRVLIDHARRRDAEKRGGARRRLPLDEGARRLRGARARPGRAGEALERLGGVDRELMRIVELRFFGGASKAEVAEVLGVSTRTVERGWKTARAWLRADLGGGAAK